VPRTRPEAAEGFVQCRKNRPGIAAQLGAEILGTIIDTRLLQKIDAAIDLVHMVAGAHHIERELGRGRLAGGGGIPHGGDGCFLARTKRPDRSAKRIRTADRIVGLARTTARNGGR